MTLPCCVVVAPSLIDCNFDAGQCGWKQTDSNRVLLRWKRDKDGTSSSGTGPSKDHTGSKSSCSCAFR